MNNHINYENGIANRGNLKRLKTLMKRAQAGEKLVISFIGGSITQGSLATKKEYCYAYLVYSWWKKAFPKTEFTYINAGIGATTSQFATARVEADLLSYKPDFVIVEFSVNDENNEHFLETYEGLIRKIYQSSTKPALMIVNNVFYHNGESAQPQHEKIGKRYELPCISMRSTIYPEVASGRIPNRQITPDDLHPNDEGHGLVASVITYFLDGVLKEIDEEETPGFDDHENFPEPMTVNAYEHSVRYNNLNSTPICEGFIADNEKQSDITDCFKNGWFASDKGATISFEIEGTGISVQYRKSVKKPAPIAEMMVDGNKRIRLDANFDEDWGDKLELETITEHTEKMRHKVQITIVEACEHTVPFYLASVIGSN